MLKNIKNVALKDTEHFSHFYYLSFGFNKMFELCDTQKSGLKYIVPSKETLALILIKTEQ